MGKSELRRCSQPDRLGRRKSIYAWLLQLFSQAGTMNRALILYLPLMAMLGLGGCDYPKKIQEHAEPWRVLEPGQPPMNPRVEILEQGQGLVVEPGDLVQVRVTGWSFTEGRWLAFGEWWIWIGFSSSKENAFFGYAPMIAAGLLGMRPGSKLKFLDPSPIGADHGYVGTLNPNPFGDPGYYSFRKNTTDFMPVHPLKPESGFSALEIKRVCKGPTQYRTVRLFDDSPVKVDTGSFKSYTSNEPRETWIDEARMTAECQDGRKVTFQYGPISSTTPGKKSRTPVMGYFDSWFNDAWSKIPKGVQFENNRPPVAPPTGEPTRFTTRPDTPVKIDILARASDPDGDHLTARIIKSPSHGQLTANPDGSLTYSPEKGWIGSDDLSYKVSDGLVESGLAWVYVYVAPDKK